MAMSSFLRKYIRFVIIGAAINCGKELWENGSRNKVKILKGKLLVLVRIFIRKI
jgi:hypothetical protein